jgi:hypothetical protein
MRSPDSCFILKARLDAPPESEKKSVCPHCSRFCSKTLFKNRFSQKTPTQNGVLLGWLIDLQGREVWVYRQNGLIERVVFSVGKVSGEDVLPDFELDVSIFGTL